MPSLTEWFRWMPFIFSVSLEGKYLGIPRYCSYNVHLHHLVWLCICRSVPALLHVLTLWGEHGRRIPLIFWSSDVHMHAREHGGFPCSVNEVIMYNYRIQGWLESTWELPFCYCSYYVCLCLYGIIYYAGLCLSSFACWTCEWNMAGGIPLICY